MSMLGSLALVLSVLASACEAQLRPRFRVSPSSRPATQRDFHRELRNQRHRQYLLEERSSLESEGYLRRTFSSKGRRPPLRLEADEVLRGAEPYQYPSGPHWRPKEPYQRLQEFELRNRHGDPARSPNKRNPSSMYLRPQSSFKKTLPRRTSPESYPRRPLTPPGAPGGEDIPLEVLQVLPDAVKGVYARYGPSPPAPTTTAKPPVVWFPDLNAECEEAESGGGGFSALSFLAMVVSIVNLVSILASNANNNLNNNNDNNNINNANIQDSNEDNNNNNLDIFTMVTFAGRRRRDLSALLLNATRTQDDLFTPTPEDVAAGVGVIFLRAWYQSTLLAPPLGHRRDEREEVVRGNTTRKTTSATARGAWSPGCVQRVVCEANRESAAMGGLAEDVAEVLSAAYAEFLPAHTPSRPSLLRAASRGRSGWDCPATYQCDREQWAAVTHIRPPDVWEVQNLLTSLE
ncbi:uncharacterized protein LOC122255726 [Penaeus japonicus]|uniref:uncharacterized protein LOC122255726 n=1 Tax=Penaeus japonicus TaxID=27405 RepID=UPI001C70E634|nr:uncharacterized protein LOC122255726 [Penaeus japonicus]